jgi:hypothetical protein
MRGGACAGLHRFPRNRSVTFVLWSAMTKRCSQKKYILRRCRCTHGAFPIPLSYRFDNKRLANPAAKPTAAAAVTPPIAASRNFLLSSCSFASMLARWSSRASLLSGCDRRIFSVRSCWRRGKNPMTCERHGQMEYEAHSGIPPRGEQPPIQSTDYYLRTLALS